MAQPSAVNVDDLRRRARRRLVGAIVLALSAAVFVPMLLESEPRPLGEDVSVKIPPVDNGKFVNKLNAKGGSDTAKAAPGKAEMPKADTPKAEMPKADAPKADAAPADPAAILAGGPTNVPSPVPANAPPAGTATDSSAPAAPRKSLAEAEQKVLSAAGKAPTAAPTPTPVTAVAPKAATPVEAPQAEPPKAEPAKVATDSPGFSVQLAAFTDDKGANSLVNKLTKAGYVAYVEPVTNSRGTMWRVRVGPFPAREAAVASREKLKGDGYSGIVTPSK